MNAFARLPALCLVLASLAGCTSVLYEREDTGPTAGAAATPSKGMRAGIVSTLGNQPVDVHVSEGAGPNTQEVEPVQDWDIDFYTETLVERWASSRAMKTVPVGSEGRKAFKPLSSFRGVANTELLDLSLSKGAVQAFAAREGLDYVFIVTPAKLPEQYAGKLEVFNGYGQWNRDTLSGCFAALRITVVDKGGKILKQDQSSRMSRRPNSALAGRRLDQLSDTLRREQRDCILDAIGSSIETIVLRLGM